MKFIHNRDKNSVSILDDKKQLIVKIIGQPLLFCPQRTGWFLACGKETIRIDITSHKNNCSVLDVFYQKCHVLSFATETPERPACLSIYDELPSLLSVPEITDIQKNKWILTDYRDHSNVSLVPKKIQKSKNAKLLVPIMHRETAHVRGL